MKKIYILILSAICVISCSENRKADYENETEKINKNFYSNIKTTVVKSDNDVKELSFTGKVISNPEQTVNYIPLINGVVVRTYFSLGDKVKNGQNMIDIKSVDYKSLETEHASLETELNLAKRELSVAEELYKDNMYSEKEYLEIKGKYKQAEDSYNQIRSELSFYGKNKGNGVFTIVAPCDGYVTMKNVVSGGNIFSEGDALFSIVDLNEVCVEANIYAGNLRFIYEGLEAEINSSSYPDKVFKGKVNTISHVFDPEDKTLKARIFLPNTEKMLKPEMPVLVKIKNPGTGTILTIPSDAVIFDNDLYYVIIKDENDYQIKNINIKDRHEGLCYVSDGLKDGDEVVSKNQLLIYNQLKWQ